MVGKPEAPQILLNAYLEQERQDNAYPISDDEFFEMFSASQVLKEYDISDEEVEQGICDASGDGGCDGIYLFADQALVTSEFNVDNAKKGVVLDLVILQAKTCCGFSESAIQNWKTTCGNLMDISKGLTQDAFQSRYNEKVRCLFEMFRSTYIALVRKSPKLNVRFCYVTKGMEVHPTVQEQANELVAMIKKLFPSPTTSCTVTFITAQALLDLAQKVVDNEFFLRLAGQPIICTQDTAYIALVKLNDYFHFIANDKNELVKHIFEANVRDYQGNVVVNQDIQESLESEASENFWWLNNGATIVASEACLTLGTEIRITDPEIVNGLQTSTEIFKYFSRHPEKLESEQRSLLVRIIVPSDEASRDKIIFATNNQTQILKSTLRVTDLVHRQIELYFKSKELYYDRRKNYYKNAGKKPAQIVSVVFLSQCLMSVLLARPNDARARPSTLLTEDSVYNCLYSEKQPLAVYYNIAAIGRKVETILKSNALSASLITDIKFYVLYAAFANHFNKVDVVAKDIESIQPQDITDSLIENAIREISSLYMALGGNDKVAKGSELIEKVKEALQTRFSSERHRVKCLPLRFQGA